jgi:AcrR family transcriptional regulator
MTGGPASHARGAPATRRWQERHWVEHALGELRERGPQALTLERLCASAGRTRGSLYHHFSDHQALLSAVIRHWRERFTDAVIQAIRDERLRGSRAAARLNDLATALDFQVETGIRHLAASYPALQPEVDEVDRRRIAFLAELRREAGTTASDAQVTAELEYAAYVGAQHLCTILPAARLRALYRHLERLLLSADGRG